MGFRVGRDSHDVMQFVAFFKHSPDAVPEDSAQLAAWRRRGAQRVSQWPGRGKYDLAGMAGGEAG